MVNNYKGDVKKEGIGLSFIVENFNKGSQMATVYVTFFDIASKKVLISEKLSGKAMGIGMRNYWAGAIKAMLKQIDLTEYKNWKTKY
jgi:trans-2-enoyl-CoA reductase